MHPTALKDLLELIVLCSNFNQFIISTHSNIVVRYLASEPNSKLFNVTVNNVSNYPTSVITEVGKAIDARLAVLSDLGYSISDFHLWDGWLFLEESSAERIIRDYLIPWFAPALLKIGTLATGGTSKVESSFENFNRLVLYAHLESAYINKAWVFVDGDESGKEIIGKLKLKYKLWNSDRFKFFKSAQFENYYPEVFLSEVTDTLQILNKQDKRAAKEQLLKNVIAWLEEDKQREKAALQTSAKEIIAHLKDIENTLYIKS